jgi:GT2 family glycosyltransferase
VLRCVLSALQSGPVDRIELIIAEDAAHVDANWILGYFLPYASIYKNRENLGFLLSCRKAVSRSTGPIVLLVNNDVIVHKGAVEEILAAFESRADAAVVGGLVLNADGTIQENSGMLWRDASAWNYHRGWKREDEYALNIREADYVSGCWIGIRRSAWNAVGGFDTRYVPAYYEESDLCLSAWRHGYKVYINPLSVVTHLDGATMGQDEDNPSSLKAYQKINRQKFHQKWRGLLEASHRENGKPTVFHTGRNDPRRFVSLIFDHYIPEPDRDAGSRTMYVVCQALAAVEGNYVLFIPANNHRSPYAAGLERLGIEVITGAEGWKRFDTLLSQDNRLIRYAFVSRIGVAQKFSWHLNQLNCRKSLYIHDIEALRGFQHDPDACGYGDLVKAAMDAYAARHEKLFATFDDIVSLSEDETRLLQPYFGNKLVDVFPYDFAAPEPTAAPSERNDILFVGSYNHPPNREAIANFIDNIWPDILKQLPKATLHLCGSGFENADSLAGPNLVRHGLVSDQTLAYLYSISRVSIAPLLTGAGMKGKVIESCAHGVPCVGTELAWQGIPLPEEYAHLTGNISTYADRLLETYRDHSATTKADLRRVYQFWQGANRIPDIIPKLIHCS